MNKILALLALLALFVLSALSGPGAFAGSNIDDTAMEKRYQHDADTVRLRHLKKYAELIQEFIDTTGRVPFQGVRDQRLHLFIATEEQQPYADASTKRKDMLRAEDFRKELEQGLNRNVRLWFDPQRVPSGSRPTWYYYTVLDNCFTLFVNLFEPYDIAEHRGNHDYVLGITNCVDSKYPGMKSIDELLTNPNFIEASNREFKIQTGWFEQLEEANQ